MVILPQIVFSGIFGTNEKINVGLRWIQWICPLKYGTALAALNEFHDLPDRLKGKRYKLSAGGALIPGYDRLDQNDIEAMQEAKAEFLAKANIQEFMYWPYIGILLVFAFGLRAIACWRLSSRAKFIY